MKKSSDDTIREELARDLTERFFELLRQYPEKEIRDIMKMVPSQKAPRFYVGFETARRHLSNLRRELEFHNAQPNKTNLYAELYRRWKAINGGNDYEKNSYACLHDIINSPAPCFYIDYETARSIIYKYLRKK